MAPLLGPALSTVFLGGTPMEKPAVPGLCEMEAGKKSREHRVMEIPVCRKPAQGCCSEDSVQGDWTKTNCPYTAQQGSALVPQLFVTKSQFTAPGRTASELLSMQSRAPPTGGVHTMFHQGQQEE